LPPFLLDDPEAIRVLMTQAGFDRIVVEPRCIVRAVPPVRRPRDTSSRC
jgi:hypothetical protein